jgi:hypothetical protein
MTLTLWLFGFVRERGKNEEKETRSRISCYLKKGIRMRLAKLDERETDVRPGCTLGPIGG